MSIPFTNEGEADFQRVPRLSKIPLHLKVERSIHFGDSRKRNAYARKAEEEKRKSTPL